MTELAGAHAIVTGASRGLGRVIADALAAEGADITLAARSAGELDATRAHVERRGGRVLAVPTDVADADDRARLVASARAELGPIDVLVNNAGIESTAWFTDLDPAEVEHLIAVNLTAPLLLTKLVLPDMLARRRGHIVNVGSIAGKAGGPCVAVYSATKGGLGHASESLRAELVGTGVSVSTVCPGFVEEVGMYARDEREAGVHASRWIGTTTPEKVADAVVRALRRDAPELIVSPGPFRVMAAAGQLFPALGAPVTNRLVGRMLRAVADHRRGEPERPAPPPGRVPPE
jgi:short-subunit dehydrogenase